MKLRYKLFFVWLIAAWVFILGHACAKSKPLIPSVLPPNDTEQLLIDPVKHKITILTPSGPKVITLPDHITTIDIHKDGTVKVTAPQFGFETRPFIGLGLGQGLRLYAGADLGYWKKLDIGLGVGTPRLLDKSGMQFNDVRIGVFTSYNVYDNTRLTLGLDTQKTIHLLLSVRI